MEWYFEVSSKPILGPLQKAVVKSVQNVVSMELVKQGLEFLPKGGRLELNI